MTNLNHDELIATFLKVVRSYDEGEANATRDIHADAKDAKTAIGYIVRLNDRYLDAMDAARKFGLIGVGCITFAEGRLIRFQERIARQIELKAA